MAQVFTIQELAAEVGGDITPRTIRYYIAEGLLPKPDERGQYTRSHLQRLQLIRRYREAFVPLEKIRSQLVTLTDAQVTETLQETPSPVAPAESAADYTARLLAGISGQPPPEPPASAPAAKAGGMAASGAPAPSSPDLQETLSLHRKLNESSVSRKRSIPTDAPEVETWERIQLAPGIELHRRVPLTPEADEYLQALLTFIRTLHKPAR